METKLGRIADKSKNEVRPIYTSLYHMLNDEMLIKCHKEMQGNRAVGIDEMTKAEYNSNLEEDISKLVDRLKNKSYKSLLLRHM